MRPLRRLFASGTFLLAAAAALAANDTQVIYPGGAVTPVHSAAVPGPGLGAVTVLGSLVLAGAGGWLLWRGRRLPFQGRDLRKLAIEETRSLGSRQYLVVASYEGRKLLLGVCPGRIDLLTPLDTVSTRERAS